MPAVSVAGAAFTVESRSPPSSYTSTGHQRHDHHHPNDHPHQDPRRSVAFDQTDLNSTMSVEFLYDEDTGLYDALQTAAAAGNSLAVSVASASGTWTGAAMYVESVDLTFEATGIATASVSMTGAVTFA
jgi:hypothetical protein